MISTIQIHRRNDKEVAVHCADAPSLARDLPLRLDEDDAAGWVATVEFTYDDRGRLIRENRYGIGQEAEYDLSYYYDNGGNRTLKTDEIDQIRVEYHYDIADPSLYESNNNRLEYYETIDVSDPKNPARLSTTWYYYNPSGNTTWVVTNQAETDDYSATRLIYAKNGQAVSLMVNETWTWDGVAPQGQRTLNPLCHKNLHQEAVIPSAVSTLAHDAVL